MSTRGWTLPWGLGFTLAVHGAIFASVAVLGPPKPAMRPMPPVKVRLVAPPPKETPKPPPAPPEEVKPPPPPPPPKEERVKPPPPPPKPPMLEPPPPKEPPPPRPEPPKPEPPKPEPPKVEPPKEPEVKPPSTPPPGPGGPATRRSFSANLDATQGGSVQVPSGGGGSTRGDPRLPSRDRDRGSPGDRDDDGEGRGKGAGSGAGSGSAPVKRKPVDAASVTTLPSPLSKPSDDELRDAYPEVARQKGLDGNVVLELLVDEEGRVARVRVTRPAGDGFDEVAVRLVKRHRFRPGRKDGVPVSVWIPYTYKFRLGD